jgi:hypothetical protein
MHTGIPFANAINKRNADRYEFQLHSVVQICLPDGWNVRRLNVSLSLIRLAPAHSYTFSKYVSSGKSILNMSSLTYNLIRASISPAALLWSK